MLDLVEIIAAIPKTEVKQGFNASNSNVVN